MGSTASQEASEEDAPALPEFLERSQSGYRILAVQEKSPTLECGGEATASLVPYFDFIVRANGVDLVEDAAVDESAEPGSYTTFVEIIQAFENKPLEITLYNCKCKRLRNLTFVPRRGWGGQGLLGLTIKYASFKGADDNVAHVLDVAPGSPASEAGLVSFSDYLLGTPYVAFADIDELNDLVNEVAAENDRGADEALDLFVYSVDTDIIRRVAIKPRPNWGGAGLLGCGIGHGYLHRMPKRVQGTTGKPRHQDLIKIDPRKAAQATAIDATASASASSAARAAAPPTSATTTPAPDHAPQPPADDTVQVSGLGKGTLCGTKGGAAVVLLDWQLPNGATAIAFVRNDNLTRATDHTNPLAATGVESKIDLSFNSKQDHLPRTAKQQLHDGAPPPPTVIQVDLKSCDS